jgi:ubiquinone biosynthesis protein COQ4
MAMTMTDLVSSLPSNPRVAESLHGVAAWLGEYSTRACEDPVDAARRLRPHLDQLLSESGADHGELDRQLAAEPVLAPLLAEHYLPPEYEAEDLAHYPPGTVARAYHDFLARWGLRHNYYGHLPTRTPREYLLFRSINYHDYWHLASGYGADPLGEVGAVSFTLANRLRHLGAVAPRLCLQLSVTLAGSMARYALHFPDLLQRWQQQFTEGYRRGQEAGSLDLVSWEQHWERPLAQLRAELGITPAPAPERHAEE